MKRKQLSAWQRTRTGDTSHFQWQVKRVRFALVLPLSLFSILKPDYLSIYILFYLSKHHTLHLFRHRTFFWNFVWRKKKLISVFYAKYCFRKTRHFVQFWRHTCGIWKLCALSPPPPPLLTSHPPTTLSNNKLWFEICILFGMRRLGKWNNKYVTELAGIRVHSYRRLLMVPNFVHSFCLALLMQTMMQWCQKGIYLQGVH